MYQLQFKIRVMENDSICNDKGQGHVKVRGWGQDQRSNNLLSVYMGIRLSFQV